jgi:hypothetical protein
MLDHLRAPWLSLGGAARIERSEIRGRRSGREQFVDDGSSGISRMMVWVLALTYIEGNTSWSFDIPPPLLLKNAMENHGRTFTVARTWAEATLLPLYLRAFSLRQRSLSQPTFIRR